MEAKKISSTFMRAMGNEAIGAIEFDGYKWKVDISSGANIECIYNMNDLIKYSNLFIRHLAKNSQKKKIAVSIPAGAYEEAKDREDGGLVEKFKQSILTNVPWAEEVVVLPQGVVALNYLAKTKKVNPLLGNTLIIDGGFNTVNVSIVDTKGTIIHTKTIHDELGVYNLVMDFFRIELQSNYDEVPENPQVLKEIFLKEVLDGGLNRVVVKNEKQRAIRAFVSKLISRITNDVKKEKKPFDQLAFVGGISYYIDKKEIETSKEFYVPNKDGEFLTVSGMKEIVGDDFDVFDIGFGDTKYIVQ